MYAPLFTSHDGKSFVVVDKNLVFNNWMSAAASSDLILKENKWSMVRWSGYVVDAKSIPLERTREFIYNNVPVMVIENG